jgi:hypothetical protein
VHNVKVTFQRNLLISSSGLVPANGGSRFRRIVDNNAPDYMVSLSRGQ